LECKKKPLFLSMKTIKHRRFRTLFDCTFLVLGLVLLVVQSSPKFYLLASNPISSGASKISAHKSILSSATASPNYHNGNSLSLDKRFDYKQVVALISPLFRSERLSTELKTEACDDPGKPVLTIIPATFRRGPPSLS